MHRLAIVDTSTSNETTSVRSPVNNHVPCYIYILHILVTSNAGRETKVLYPLLKILKHSTCFVVCATFQIYYGSAVAIDVFMDDKSP